MSVTGKNPAIETLCDLIQGLPQAMQDDLVSHAAMNLGILPKPTGLEEAPHRSLKQLVWDDTIDDIRKRCEYLASAELIDEEILVMGVLASYRSHLGLCADQDHAERARESNEFFIQHANDQLLLPVDQRKNAASDEVLNFIRATALNALESMETRRLQAVDELESFQSLTEGTFTKEFWNDFHRMKHL